MDDGIQLSLGAMVRKWVYVILDNLSDFLGRGTTRYYIPEFLVHVPFFWLNTPTLCLLANNPSRKHQ